MKTTFYIWLILLMMTIGYLGVGISLRRPGMPLFAESILIVLLAPLLFGLIGSTVTLIYFTLSRKLSLFWSIALTVTIVVLGYSVWISGSLDEYIYSIGLY